MYQQFKIFFILTQVICITFIYNDLLLVYNRYSAIWYEIMLFLLFYILKKEYFNNLGILMKKKILYTLFVFSAYMY